MAWYVCGQVAKLGYPSLSALSVPLLPKPHHLADLAEHVHGGHFSDRAKHPVVPARIGGENHHLKGALAALRHFPLALHGLIEPGTDQRHDIVISTLAAEASRTQAGHRRARHLKKAAAYFAKECG